MTIEIQNGTRMLEIRLNVMTDNKVRHKHRALNRNIKQVTVTPTNAVQHARWKVNDAMTSICTQCGYLAPYSLIDIFNYCPNCGCKIDWGGRQRDETQNN